MSVPPPPPRRRNAPEFGGSAAANPPPPPPPDPEARAQRRAEEEREQSSSQRRWIAVLAGVLVIAIIAVAAIVALSGGNGKKKEKDRETVASTAVNLKVGQLQLVSVQGGGELPPDLADQVLGVIGQYVDDGIVGPLRKGTADDQKLAAIFDAGAIARLATDRPVLLDEGLPKATGNIKITAPPVNMLGLASGPAVVLMTTAIDFKIKAELSSGTVTIHRQGTLVFVRQDSGEWQITGWTLHVDRNGTGVQATTTAPPTTVAQ